MGRPFSSMTLKTDATAEQFAYLAGLIDGDGSILLERNRNSLYWRVVVSNNNTEIMHWLVETFGGRWMVLKPRKYIHPGAKTEYSPVSGNEWDAGGTKNVRWLLVQLAPYLVIKKPRAFRCLADLRGGLHKSAPTC